MNRRILIYISAFAIAMAFAQPSLAGSLKFTANVPPPPAELQLLKLTPHPAPIELVEKFLSRTHPTKLTPLVETPFFQKNGLKVPNDIIGAVEEEHVRGWVDKRTGDARLFPLLGTLEPLSSADVERHASIAEEIFHSPDFIAHDDTRFVVDKPNTLLGQRLVREPNGEVRAETEKAPYLAYFSARRFVGEFPVDGPGSRALVEVGRKGAVEGIVRSWKLANIERTVTPSLNIEQVKTEIAHQLEPALVNSDVTVDRIEFAYFDSHQQYLQPVIRFTAQIHQVTMPKTPSHTADNFVIGYIPFGKAFEPLPVLGESTGPKPEDASKSPIGPRPKTEGEPSNDPVVGRYVVRNDDPGWVNDANAFWNSLSSTSTGSLFSNAQYYWAEPRLFTNQKDAFINAMNLALIEVHGDWWLFSTLQNCCDLVNIQTDIPSPGYGPSANGQLADWIIHSCEVVPSPDDTSTWPAPWWAIFDGVRNAVGYRTIMYINDGAGGPYGTSLGNLAPIVSSWLSDVMSLNAYSGHPTAIAHGGISRPMGRPSTISACGHDGDSVLSTSSLGRAKCLTVWWFPD